MTETMPRLCVASGCYKIFLFQSLSHKVENLLYFAGGERKEARRNV